MRGSNYLHAMETWLLRDLDENSKLLPSAGGGKHPPPLSACWDTHTPGLTHPLPWADTPPPLGRHPPFPDPPVQKPPPLLRADKPPGQRPSPPPTAFFLYWNSQKNKSVQHTEESAHKYCKTMKKEQKSITVLII